MENKTILKTYKDLGIKVDTLPSNYTPESFGKKLMSQYRRNYQISYSANTITKKPIENQ